MILDGKTGRGGLLTPGGLALACLLACNDGAPSGGPSQASPNASILPAPLVAASEIPGTPSRSQLEPGTEPSAARIPAALDSAGRPPAPAAPELPRFDAPLPADSAPARDGTGQLLEGAFRWADLPELALGPEGPPAAVREALDPRVHAVSVQLGAGGRLRIRLESPAFPLPEGTELRARSSLHGHVIVWPQGSGYRYLAPGSLRALFTERRADVSPLLRAKVTGGGTSLLLGNRSLRTEVQTEVGTLTLDQATLPAAASGDLLCRFLLELVGAEPSAEICRPDRVPLLATFRWAPSGSLVFAVTSLTEQKETPGSHLLVPPASAQWKPGELPPVRHTLATPEQLRQLRGKSRRNEAPAPAFPLEGLVASNTSSRQLCLLIDGLAARWLAPGERVALPQLTAGRHAVAFRDFLGTFVVPAVDTEVPALVHALPVVRDGGATR